MAVMMPKEIGLDRRVGALEHRVGTLEEKVDDGFAAVDKRFDRLEDRFDALNRTLIGGFCVIVAALIGSTATLAGIVLF